MASRPPGRCQTNQHAKGLEKLSYGQSWRPPAILSRGFACKEFSQCRKIVDISNDGTRSQGSAMALSSYCVRASSIVTAQTVTPGGPRNGSSCVVQRWPAGWRTGCLLNGRFLATEFLGLVTLKGIACPGVERSDLVPRQASWTCHEPTGRCATESLNQDSWHR